MAGNRGFNKHQLAVTRHAKSKKWTADADFIYSVQRCESLIKSFDPPRAAYLKKIGAAGKVALKKYCELAGVDVAAKKSAQKWRGSGPSPVADVFLQSYEWRRVRMLVLKRDGATCACCGATRADGVKMHVDHIKPRKLFPNLALDTENLQILCEVCNHGKGNWDMTDWRNSDAKVIDDPADEFRRRFA